MYEAKKAKPFVFVLWQFWACAVSHAAHVPVSLC